MNMMDNTLLQLVDTRLYLNLLQDMVLEDHLSHCLVELEEVFILKLLMLALTWLERLKRTYLKTVLRTQLLLLIT